MAHPTWLDTHSVTRFALSCLAFLRLVPPPPAVPAAFVGALSAAVAVAAAPSVAVAVSAEADDAVAALALAPWLGPSPAVHAVAGPPLAVHVVVAALLLPLSPSSVFERPVCVCVFVCVEGGSVVVYGIPTHARHAAITVCNCV